MVLTNRQSLFLLVICLMANKVQRLPSLIATSVGRHGWLIYLALGLIDVIFLLFVLRFNRKSQNQTTYLVCERAGGKFFAKIIYVLLGAFFLFSSLLPYEAVHDIFANILFDYLSWEIYGLVLAITIFFISNRRLKNIGRVGELFFFIIAISFIVLLVLGATTTNYRRIFPITDINVPEFIDTCVEYSLWFGDFLIIYMFVGRIKKEGKHFALKTIIIYSICVVLISFAYVVFYGLYEHLSPNQNSLISAISQFSLLNLEIGRIDWFFVLFFQIGTVISSGAYLFFATDCFKQVFGIKNKIYVLIPLVMLIYFADIFVFKSIQAGASAIAYVTKYFAIFMNIAFPVMMLIVSYVASKKEKRTNKVSMGLLSKELVYKGRNRNLKGEKR